MSETMSKQKELTGRHVLMMLLAFFGILIAVNIYFAVVAVQTFRGEDVKRSYRQGLEYNQTISAREVQSHLGWTVKANLVSETGDEKTIVVQFTDADQTTLDGLDVEGVLRHPTDLGEDKAILFLPRGNGRYSVEVDGLIGQWKLRATATKGDDTFVFEHEITTQ